jgi:hypothetical protein
MLRITIRNESEATCYIIEGKLAGAWVNELENCWRAALSDERPVSILVNLTNATRIDARGKQLLVRMCRNGASLVGSGLMTKSIIQEIEDAE